MFQLLDLCLDLIGVRAILLLRHVVVMEKHILELLKPSLECRHFVEVLTAHDILCSVEHFSNVFADHIHDVLRHLHAAEKRQHLVVDDFAQDGLLFARLVFLVELTGVVVTFGSAFRHRGRSVHAWRELHAVRLHWRIFALLPASVTENHALQEIETMWCWWPPESPAPCLKDTLYFVEKFNRHNRLMSSFYFGNFWVGGWTHAKIRPVLEYGWETAIHERVAGFRRVSAFVEKNGGICQRMIAACVKFKHFQDDLLFLFVYEPVIGVALLLVIAKRRIAEHVSLLALLPEAAPYPKADDVRLVLVEQFLHAFGQLGFRSIGIADVRLADGNKLNSILAELFFERRSVNAISGETRRVIDDDHVELLL